MKRCAKIVRRYYHIFATLKFSGLDTIRTITLVGAGRLAGHFADAFKARQVAITQIWNRGEERGRQLAQRVGAQFVQDLKDLDLSGDLIMVAVSDLAIEEIISKLDIGDRLVVHVSGSVPSSVLARVSQRYGVFYPLQTFPRHGNIDFKNVPLCIEAASDADLERLMNLAGLLSPMVYRINSEQRRVLHLSAVFASNFSNFMYVIASEILRENHLDPGMLQPIISQTAMHAMTGDPFKRQTGPAVRADRQVIDRHLVMLESNPDFRELYRTITEKIIQYSSIHGQL